MNANQNAKNAATRLRNLYKFSRGETEVAVVARALVNQAGQIINNPEHGSAAFSTITGAVADNTNLQAALDLKADLEDLNLAMAGFEIKDAVVAASTAAVTLSGNRTVDGVSVTAGMRVLIKNQVDATTNGIYLSASGAWTRTTDADTWAEMLGALVAVTGGTTNGDTVWIITGAEGGTIDVSTPAVSEFGSLQFDSLRGDPSDNTALAAALDAKASATGLDDEIARATGAEESNASDIADEISRATTAEGVNATAISDEADTARAAEGALQTAIDDEETAREGADTTLTNNLAAEAVTARAAESALGALLAALVGDPNVGYVNSAGNDSTGTGTRQKPFLTPQAAVTAGFTTLNVGVGTFGNIATSGNVNLQLTGAGIGKTILGTITCSGITTTATLRGTGCTTGAVSIAGATSAAGSIGDPGTNGTAGAAMTVLIEKLNGSTITVTGTHGGAGGAALEFSNGDGGDGGAGGALLVTLNDVIAGGAVSFTSGARGAGGAKDGAGSDGADGASGDLTVVINRSQTAVPTYAIGTGSGGSATGCIIRHSTTGTPSGTTPVQQLSVINGVVVTDSEA